MRANRVEADHAPARDRHGHAGVAAGRILEVQKPWAWRSARFPIFVPAGDATGVGDAAGEAGGADALVSLGRTQIAATLMPPSWISSSRRPRSATFRRPVATGCSPKISLRALRTPWSPTSTSVIQATV